MIYMHTLKSKYFVSKCISDFHIIQRQTYKYHTATADDNLYQDERLAVSIKDKQDMISYVLDTETV